MLNLYILWDPVRSLESFLVLLPYNTLVKNFDLGRLALVLKYNSLAM